MANQYTQAGMTLEDLDSWMNEHDTPKGEALPLDPEAIGLWEAAYGGDWRRHAANALREHAPRFAA